MDGIPFRPTNYSSEPRVCRVPLSRETSRTNLPSEGGDLGDSPAASSLSPDPKDLELGFDLVKRHLKYFKVVQFGRIETAVKELNFDSMTQHILKTHFTQIRKGSDYKLRSLCHLAESDPMPTF